MRRPDLTRLINKMEKGQSFSVTREQYLSWTGADIPQTKSYTENKSAIARKAQEMGYYVKVIPEKLEFIKK